MTLLLTPGWLRGMYPGEGFPLKEQCQKENPSDSGGNEKDPNRTVEGKTPSEYGIGRLPNSQAGERSERMSEKEM